MPGGEAEAVALLDSYLRDATDLARAARPLEPSPIGHARSSKRKREAPTTRQVPACHKVGGLVGARVGQSHSADMDLHGLSWTGATRHEHRKRLQLASFYGTEPERTTRLELATLSLGS